jgi:hypothetical protein
MSRIAVLVSFALAFATGLQQHTLKDTQEYTDRNEEVNDARNPNIEQEASCVRQQHLACKLVMVGSRFTHASAIVDQTSTCGDSFVY